VQRVWAVVLMLTFLILASMLWAKEKLQGDRGVTETVITEL